MSWTVAISHPAQERKAVEKLTQRGFECFLPFVRFRGRVEVAFPRYLFVTVEPGIRELLTTSSVMNVIRSGNNPIVLRDGIMSDLKSRFGPSGILEPEPYLKHGMKVKIQRGPFYNMSGTIVRISSARRIEVLLKFLGRVETTEDNLIAA